MSSSKTLASVALVLALQFLTCDCALMSTHDCPTMTELMINKTSFTCSYTDHCEKGCSSNEKCCPSHCGGHFCYVISAPCRYQGRSYGHSQFVSLPTTPKYRCGGWCVCDNGHMHCRKPACLKFQN